MKTFESQAACPQCGAQFPSGPLAGLCPACLLEESLNSSAEYAPLSCEERPSGVFPRRFGRYLILEEIARGGMGIVFRARDEGLQRDVALKLLRAGPLATREDTRRFYLEARAAARLLHPNIVPIFEVGGPDEAQPFLAMALIPGGSLADRLKGGRVSHRDAARWLAGIARAVHHAHLHGILHRDLKPGNILFDNAGEPLVSDFGLARLLDENETLTRANAILGTPGYLAPEQAVRNSGEVTTAADVHALGAILYETLTGRPPFVDEHLPTLLRRIAEEPPVRPRQIKQDISDDLETICLKCLEKQPGKRYASAEAVADDLVRFLRDEPILARPVGPVASLWRWVRRHRSVSVAGVLVVGLILGFSWHNWRIVRALRGTAPTFAAEAESLVEQGQLEPALERIVVAQKLVPSKAEHHLREGDVLQALRRFSEARNAYAIALKLAPQDRRAALNLKICDEQLAMASAKSVSPATALEQLHSAILEQGRVGEALAVAREIGRVEDASLEKWRVHLQRNGIEGKLEHAADRGLELDASHAALTNLAALVGMPLSRLDLSFTWVSDLTPLRGMPLKSLNISGTPISDLTPIRRLPLESLTISDTQISDLSPLRGMGLLHLIAQRLQVSDLSPLKGMPLRFLNLYSCTNISDLRPLAGMILGQLDIYHSRVSDLSPLRNMPIYGINASATQVSDLSPLKGAQLRYLELVATPVVDLSPIHGMPIEKLYLTGTRVRDLQPLAGMPLQTLILNNCNEIQDVSPLASCPSLERLALPPNARNISALRGLPNLKRVAFSITGDHPWDALPTPEEFWTEWDSTHANENQK